METINSNIEKTVTRKNELMVFYYLFENFFLKREEELVLNERPFSNSFTKQLIQNIKSNNSKEYFETCFYSDDPTNFNFKHLNYINGDDGLIFQSYPVYNYLLLLCNNLYLSFEKRRFLFRFKELEGFNDLTKLSIENIEWRVFENNIENVEGLIQLISELINTDLNLLSEEIKLIQEKFDFLIMPILESLGERGVLTFLGLRQTPGSLNTTLIPDKELLKSTFCELNTKEVTNKNSKAKPSKLSVGARALCKHSHRSGEGFWPNSTGTETAKNIKAEEMLDKFFNECIWINIHGLPHDTPIIELRISAGYGIRWQTDGVFRGFLEPQMENGHEKGWKH